MAVVVPEVANLEPSNPILGPNTDPAGHIPGPEVDLSNVASNSKSRVQTAFQAKEIVAESS